MFMLLLDFVLAKSLRSMNNQFYYNFCKMAKYIFLERAVLLKSCLPLFTSGFYFLFKSTVSIMVVDHHLLTPFLSHTYTHTQPHSPTHMNLQKTKLERVDGHRFESVVSRFSKDIFSLKKLWRTIVKFSTWENIKNGLGSGKYKIKQLWKVLISLNGREIT